MGTICLGTGAEFIHRGQSGAQDNAYTMKQAKDCTMSTKQKSRALTHSNITQNKQNCCVYVTDNVINRAK